MVIKSSSKASKILVIIYELSKGEKKPIKFEDIAINAFKKYPNDFHLRGYPQYPDTGDSTQRPLYSLKKEGYLTASEKFFTLTEKGLEAAEFFIGKVKDKKTEKLSRHVLNELRRIHNSDVFKLFSAGEKEKIVDTDFYNYLGISVKSERTVFISRLSEMEEVIKEISNKKEFGNIKKLHNFLMKKFKAETDFMKRPERVIK